MVLRASGAPVWANCPGSTALSKFEKGDTPESLEGDLAHMLAAEIGKGRIRVNDSLEAVNMSLSPLNKTGLLVTEDIFDMAKTAAAYCGAKAAGGIWETWVNGASLPEGVQGTADYLGYDPKTETLHVIDEKYGFVSVEAVGNWQLVCYAVGALDFPQFSQAKHVHLHIVQPRDYVGEAFKVWELTRSEISELTAELHRRTASARSGTPSNTGSQCKHCESRVFCGAFRKSKAAVLETITPNPEDVPLDALGAEYEYIKRAEALVVSARKAFGDLILSKIEGGEPVQGWQIGRTGGRRYWSADIDEIKAVAGMTGLDLIQEKPISITSAWKNTAARPLIESLVKKSEGSKKLVPFKPTEVFK